MLLAINDTLSPPQQTFAAGNHVQAIAAIAVNAIDRRRFAVMATIWLYLPVPISPRFFDWHEPCHVIFAFPEVRGNINDLDGIGEIHYKLPEKMAQRMSLETARPPTAGRFWGVSS